MNNKSLLHSAASGTKSHNLYLLLRDAILSQRLSPGEKLPGEMKLAEQYNVSRVTVRRAMDSLQQAGLIMRRPGVGTVVLEQPMESTVMTASVSDLLPNMLRMSQTSKVHLLEFNYVHPEPQIRQKLRLEENEKTQRSVRVRLMEELPFSYLTTHVPASIAHHYSESNLADTPLFVLLEKSGVIIEHATQTISATLATQPVAEALEVAVGSPLLALTRVVYDKSGKGVEHLDALYRPDRYRFQIDLNRTGDEDSRHWEPIAKEEQGKDI